MVLRGAPQINIWGKTEEIKFSITVGSVGSQPGTFIWPVRCHTNPANAATGITEGIPHQISFIFWLHFLKLAGAVEASELFNISVMSSSLLWRPPHDD